MENKEAHKDSVASRLRIAREHAGLSQGQVAKILGMHRPTISEIEAGRRRVAAEELPTFAKVYKVDVTWLANGAGASGGTDRAKLELAARELAKLKRDDLDRVLELLNAMRKRGDRS